MSKTSICSYAASFCGVVLGLSLQEFVMWFGMLTGLATFLVNWYYKAKEDKRQEKRADWMGKNHKRTPH